MISPGAIKKLFSRLGLLPFFPADKDKLDALVEFIEEFASEDEQLDWLGRRMVALYREWPGPVELRACFCSRFRPKNGASNTLSAVFPEGIIPSEKTGQAPPLTEAEKLRLFGPPELLNIPEGEHQKLLAGPEIVFRSDGRKEELIPDPESRATIERLAKEMPKMPSGAPVNTRFEKILREVITAPQDRPEVSGPAPQIITQADIDQAVRELHEKRAREEATR